MIDCSWASRLSQYECSPVRDLHGSAALQIGTPFTTLGDSPIVLYLAEQQPDKVLISDNGDMLSHLAGCGVDLSHGNRFNKLRDLVKPFGLTLTTRGDFSALASQSEAPYHFAQAVSGLLAVSSWASATLNERPEPHDLAAEAEPFILARDPGAILIRRRSVLGASNSMHEFAFQHGSDLIDVIPPKPARTGASLRKAGDVQNGPAGLDLFPLIIVDDRAEPDKANHEIAILTSLTRAMPMTRLIENARPH
ncbi:hypothetical protein GCM10007320_61460 [Pseudorhodoferax aquiterrae]|uniref:DUF1828 domain-containing protein n=1 Tax=Pseudorhodoferax aquiterrae TaxID=747304 RepID=A0ABQ3GFG2_9BURK|nr:DUF1828 domain-containing protein [Pseudorhodoferax aquiterrae]GHD02319.1 hypothetical protein GCM10007320_61460 [Pseudorhodoferax aquiterrae]